jgi:deoxyadenosine/deoxycytidine kinase
VSPLPTPDADADAMSAVASLSDVTIVSLEAIIGACKSTQLDKLKATYADDPNVVFLDEPVDEWEQHGLIEAMYTDSLDRCSFQMMALVSRVARLTDAILSGAKFIVSERSPWSDCLVFARTNLQGVALTGYNYAFAKLQRVLETHAKINLLMVYLQVPSDAAQERLMHRGRPSEMPDADDAPRVPLAYQDLLRLHHERMAQMADSNTIGYHIRGQQYAKRGADKLMITRCKVIEGEQGVEAVGAQLASIVTTELAARLAEDTFKAMARTSEAPSSPASVVDDEAGAEPRYRDLAPPSVLQGAA